MEYSLTVIITLLLCLLCMRNWLRLIPSLTECVFRAKGSANLEESVPLTRDRNSVARICILPFTLIASHFRLWDPKLTANLDDFWHFLAVLGAFLIYILIRAFMQWRCAPRRSPADRYGIACRSSRNYFIICTSILLFGAGIFSLTDLPVLTIQRIFLLFLAVFYFFYLIRKTQILSTFCNPFTAFLYLCALEFLPTGALVAAAILL
ncbi:MAG: DUF4271 domain-containing protein [Bacteroidales bacterium]|nr:DUF4271 domain-containing protein [Bacteroidales bacterium]